MFHVFLVSPLLLLLRPAAASEGCLVASCSDADAQLHEGTCLNRCDCIWDSEGTPKSKSYPSCQRRPDTDEVHATSYQVRHFFMAAKDGREDRRARSSACFSVLSSV